MALSVEIDQNSGFCGGVIRAISNAELFLDSKENARLFSLGSIVHNEEELSRLAQKGLQTIDKEDLDEIVSASGETLLIRAHGEPPSTYEKASALGFEIIDCTCPVVLKLQEKIKKSYQRLRPIGGTVVIFGKIGHAEVLGLLGQADGNAIVVENKDMLIQAVETGALSTDAPVEIFSQTTKSPSEYDEVCAYLSSVLDEGLLTINRTICSQVASRHEKLSLFALSHDVIVFVSGKSSSNGKVLCDLCKSLNIRTYHVGSVADIKAEWFRDDDKVGVCGATSTPKWLLEKVASFIAEL